mmetsp:Transcript_5277/g.15553  ORF Transcript_5277/g.15553 Transcript_5277/m.15553 type:complete len:241 (+) Transcript_5277:88-810(+)
MRRQLLGLALVKTAAALAGVEVTLKIAVDRNGAVDDLGDRSGRFTSPESLDAVHRLRRYSDAVLVGAGTVVRDDPGLTVRRVGLAPRKTQPLRVVVDPRRRSPATSALFRDGHATLVFGGDDATDGDVTVKRVDGAGAGAVAGMVEVLAARGVRRLMVEGGPATARHFLKAKLVDRAVVVRAPAIFADEPVPSGIDAATLRDAGLAFAGRRDVGGDDTHVWTRGGESDAAVWDVLLFSGD